MNRLWKAAIAAGLTSVPWARASAQLAAFTGAEGFGAQATGGRGGSLYVVTNLNNSGAGSFRDAVSQSNRTIVFAVSGYDDITTPVSAASNLTILGQTAPGGGFGVYGAEVSFYGQSNDIVRYMRFRDTSQDPGGTGTGNSSGNCVNLGNTSNMIFDHDSLEFASYNNVDASGTTGANNLTFQNSIIANPIQSQQFNFHWEANQATFINNIFANAHNRSILAKGNVQFVNNTDYNYQAGFTTGDSGGAFSFDMVNNYSVAGPSTSSASDAYYQVDSTQVAYAKGNLLDSNKNGTLSGSSANSIDGATASSTPWSTATAALPTLSATASYAFNLMHSGDSLTHDPTTFASSTGYDQVDQQVINDVASYGTQGQLYNTEKDDGLSNNGLGTITSGTAPTSTANDGIPDSWKMTHGLSTGVADSTLLNPLGYMMIEQYAQEISDEYSTQAWTATSGEWNTNASNWPTLAGQIAATPPGPYVHALISGNGSADGMATVSTGGATAYSLQIGANGLAAGEKLLVSGGSLTVYNGITVGYQNNGLLQITGGTVQAATVQLGNTVWNATGSSSNTYTGTLILSGGTLQTTDVVQGGGTPGNWTTGSAWTWSGGTLQAGPAGLLVSAPATLGSAGGILDTNGVAAQISGVLTGSGGFTVIGGGTATVSGLNTYLGPTTISASTLVASALAYGGSPSSLGASSNASANLILNGATLQGTGVTDRLFTLASSSALDNSNGMSFINTGAIALASGANLTLTLQGSSTAHNTFSPALADVGGGFTTSVVVSGSGKWDFSNGVKSYSGDTDVTGGTLETLSQNALSPQSNIVISSGAILDFHAYSQTINALEGAGTVNDSFGTAQTFTIGAVNGSGTFSGTVNGPVSIIKNGTGTEDFSGANAYTGSTSINAGILQISSSGNLGGGTAGNSITFNGGTLESLSGTYDLTSNRTVALTGAATFQVDSGSLTVSGALSGPGPLSKTGAGTLILSASNPNAGPTTITGGTLALQANSGNTNAGVSSVLGAGNLTLASNATLQLLGTTNNTIFRPANFVESGYGNPFNFYVGNNGSGTGNTLILANVGQFGPANSNPATFNLSGDSGYTLQLGSGTAGTGALNFYNNTVINSNTAGVTLAIPGGMVVNYPAAYTLTFGGAGNFNLGPLVQNGSNALTPTFSGTGTTNLTGTSTYTGLTTVSSGTLNVNNGSLATPAITIGATGLVTLTGNNTLTSSTITINSGVVTIASGTTTATGTANPNLFIGAATSAATVAVNSGATFTDVTGAFFKVGANASSVGVLNNAGNMISAGYGGDLGGGSGASGAIYNTGTFTSTNTSGVYLGNSVGAYGYIYNGGTGAFTDTAVLGLSRNDVSGAAGSGVLDLAGGTVTLSSAANLSINDDAGTANNTQATSQINITGGTLTAGSTTAGTVQINNSNSSAGAYASVNVSGKSAIFSTPASSVINLNGVSNNNNVSTLSLANGGTLLTSAVTNTGSALSTGVLSLNNGTLKATAANTLIASGVTTLVESGGATIDNGGFAVTIASALQAPTGSGLTGATLGGTDSGYIGAPVVVISGGGGTGAAAIANFNPATGTITGITITSPGSGYTSAPTITLVGGSGTIGTGAAAGAATATATIGTVASGGITFQGNGTTTLTSASTYGGATTVNGGALKLDFSAAGAPTSNILSASSALTLSNTTLQIVGSAAAASSQTFASTAFNTGPSTISAAPASGSNLPTLALGTLGSPSYGTTVELQGPATIYGAGNVAATATITTATAGTGANGAIASLGNYSAGAYMTVGQYDWATTNAMGGGAGASPYTILGGSQATGFYQTTGVTTAGNYDVNSSGVNTMGNQAGASTVRFNSPTALTLTFTATTAQDMQGILVTPNIGAHNVSITGGGLEFIRSTTAGTAYGVIWQNNTSGYLNFSSIIEAGRQAGQSNGLVQAGPGTVVYSAVNTYELQTFLNGGYSVVSADSGFGQVTDGSAINLNGGTVVANSTFTMDNAGSNARPFVLGGNGGGLAATTGNVMTIDGAVSGSGALTIGVSALPGSGPGTANTTAVAGNGTVALTNANSYSGGTTINAGTLLANSTDTTNGSTGSGTVTVASGGTLGGTGQIRGSIIVHGIITAGTAASGVAPGVLTANAPGQITTFAGGGTYDVKIDSSSGNGTAGSNWDEVVLSTLAVTASSGNAFNVTLNSLNSANTPGAITGAAPSLWTLGTMTTAPTGVTLSGNGTTILAVSGTGPGAPTVTSGDTGIFALNTSAFDTANAISSSNSYFVLELVNTSGTNYSLDVYTSAPEPGTAVFLLGGLSPLLLSRRRRKAGT